MCRRLGTRRALVKVAVLVSAAEAAKATPPERGKPRLYRRIPLLSLHGRGTRLSTNNSKKLNENQRALIETLAASGGRVPVEGSERSQCAAHHPRHSSAARLIELVDEPQDFTTSQLKPRQSPFEFEFKCGAEGSAPQDWRVCCLAHSLADFCCNGITGSGKTAVYLACMRQVLDAGRSSILLVPEIGLTPAVAADLHQVFGDEVAILHSGLSNAERAEQWHRIRRGEARVVAGTRSAVFAPVSDLALIIVDEEQDSSYKQEETPRYHARDVAVMRAKWRE